MMSKRKKQIIFLAAMLLLAVALFWNLMLNKFGEGARLARQLNEDYGYALQADDIYPAADWQDTTIRALFPEQDLAAAMEASRSVGLPSDIDRKGHVALILANTKENIVITLYLLDGEIELGFLQEKGTENVFPLGSNP